jgi:S-adenosylmethionine:tRNA ribosyltransferase-isomerase
MVLSDFDYHLPEELIAQEPAADRAGSRMLVVNRESGVWQDRMFRDLPQFIRPGDCLALNDTRVFPSRLVGALTSGGMAEVFLLRPQSADSSEWLALVRPGRRLRHGARATFSGGLEAEIIGTGDRGERTVRLSAPGDVRTAIELAGHVPLPPYIHREDRPEDRERYQTVYAREYGSAAAPTAGLHFTPQVLDQCRSAGAAIAPLTLHVGLGTFQPLAQEEVEANRLHPEHFEIGPEAVQALRAARRIIAVGTTSVRVIETAAAASTGLQPMASETEIFIYPGYRFQAVQALLTNFHLPRSSLLLLVSAFAGTDLTLAAYRHAVSARYRFFSYGDCMLIV